jgi:enoyl-CoA hydratase/carnithine racemase
MADPNTAVADLVYAEQRGPVLLLTLNRPDRLNAWTDALEERYYAHLAAADADPAIRAVVLTGAGPGFCAGADLSDLEGVEGSELAELPARQRPRSWPLTFRKPLIAAINGAAAGLGLVEALYCDVRFAVPTAKFTTSFTKRGLIAEYGVAWLLPRLVGQSRALDLLMSSRVVLGDEALRIGLVDHLAEPADLVDAAIAYASGLATLCSPWAMSIVKQQVMQGMDTIFAEAERAADVRMLESFRGPDVVEGVRSYVERRPAAFTGIGR